MTAAAGGGEDDRGEALHPRSLLRARRNVASTGARLDDDVMRASTSRADGDARRRRSHDPSLALHFQLAACCDDGEIAAMAMADDDGRPLALAGEFGACREVADKLARVASRIHSAEYVAYGPGQRWDVSMQRVATGTGDVIVCAIGGSAAERRQRIGRTAAAAQRILAA